jgi:hypothetical protein
MTADGKYYKTRNRPFLDSRPDELKRIANLKIDMAISCYSDPDYAIGRFGDVP